MNSSPSICKDEIRALALECGATACGFAEAAPVDAAEVALYKAWLADGRDATMEYCRRNADVRYDPRLLLDGARTLIVCAFPYYRESSALPLAPLVSRYAWGADYHIVVKDRLRRLGEMIVSRWGGRTRAVVDSAPLRERYWARKAGIGFTGLNSQLFVVNREGGVEGSWHFIGTLLWTGSVSPDAECTLSCDGCGACVRSCPGAALDGKGGCDGRRCLSYLTIENRETDPVDVPATMTTIYGCDICQKVCPLNAGVADTAIPEFTPDPAILGLAPDDLRTLTPSRFSRLTRGSAMSRVPLRQLLRNLSWLYPNLC